MGGDRCVRCGRQRSAHEPLRPGEGPWLRLEDGLEDGDVCPDCQTPEERAEAARRIVAAIEHEVERRRAEGFPPDAAEAALIAYAMGTRDAAEDPQPMLEPSADPTTRPDDIRGRCLRVAVTGAFLTGRPLAVRLDTYAELQSALAAVLKAPRWRVDMLREQDGTYESGGGFTKDLPLVIARRDGADLLPWLAGTTNPRAPTGAGRRVLPVELRRARPIGLDIDVYDLGVAVMTAWLDVLADPAAELETVARAVKELVWLRAGDEGRSQLASVLQEIASVAAQEYGDAVTASASRELQAGWLSRATPDALEESPERAADQQGRLLWLHPVHVLETGADGDTPTQQRRDAKALAPTFHRRLTVEQGVFAAGIGSSAVVASAGSSAVVTSLRLTKLHWAYYALYMEIDRGLLLVLNQQRWSRPAPLRSLEADADAVFADYLRVLDARARLDSHLSALGGDELAIWETVARVQRFDAVEDAVDRKLEVLQKVAQRRVEQASAYRTRRLGDILGSLTVLTVVTVAVALIGTFLGSRTHGIDSVWVRAAIVALAGVTAVAIYWVAFVRTTRPRPIGARSEEV